MKTLIILTSIFLGLGTTVLAKEKNVKSSAKVTKAQKQPSGLSTDIKFGDQTVGGKYQLPMEALSVVENEKSIDDLIGVRKNFRDRIARTKGMR